MMHYLSLGLMSVVSQTPDERFWNGYEETFQCTTRFPLYKHAVDDITILPGANRKRESIAKQILHKWAPGNVEDEALEKLVEHVLNNGVADLLP